MFVNNRYKYWYFRLIVKAAKRVPPRKYTEKHHVIPRSLGGANTKRNLVILTYREHFLAHWLLVRCTEGVAYEKMCRALQYMSLSRSGRMISSWQYTRARKAAKDAALLYRHTEESKRKISAAHKGKIISSEYRAKISAGLIGRKRGPHSESHRKAIGAAHKGRKHSAEHRENNRLGQVKRAATTGMFDLNSIPQRFCTVCGNWFAAGMHSRWHEQKCKSFVLAKQSVVCLGFGS